VHVMGHQRSDLLSFLNFWLCLSLPFRLCACVVFPNFISYLSLSILPNPTPLYVFVPHFGIFQPVFVAISTLSPPYLLPFPACSLSGLPTSLVVPLSPALCSRTALPQHRYHHITYPTSHLSPHLTPLLTDFAELPTTDTQLRLRLLLPWLDVMYSN